MHAIKREWFYLKFVTILSVFNQVHTSYNHLVRDKCIFSSFLNISIQGPKKVLIKIHGSPIKLTKLNIELRVFFYNCL